MKLNKKPKAALIRHRLIEHHDKEGFPPMSSSLGSPGGPQLFRPRSPAEREKLSEVGLLDDGLWVNALDLTKRLKAALRSKLDARQPRDPQASLERGSR